MNQWLCQRSGWSYRVPAALGYGVVVSTVLSLPKAVKRYPPRSLARGVEVDSALPPRTRRTLPIVSSSKYTDDDTLASYWGCASAYRRSAVGVLGR